MKSVVIYTDGACSGNPGPGGWGAILIYNGHSREISGGEPNTTNNRMELLGVINALGALKEPCDVMVYTDSRYVVDGIEKGWAQSWRKKRWRKADGSPAKNPDLWENLLALCNIHKVKFSWVKGHASNPYNNKCDQLAVSESNKYKS